MPNRPAMAGHIYQGLSLPSYGPLGESQSALARGRFDDCRSTVDHANHQTTRTAPGCNEDVIGSENVLKACSTRRPTYDALDQAMTV